MDNYADIIYLIYKKLDITSAICLSQTSKFIRSCIPKYILEHKRKFSSIIRKINEIEYTIGAAELYFRGKSMIGTYMISAFDGSTCKNMVGYSIPQFNSLGRF